MEAEDEEIAEPALPERPFLFESESQCLLVDPVLSVFVALPSNRTDYNLVFSGSTADGQGSAGYELHSKDAKGQECSGKLVADLFKSKKRAPMPVEDPDLLQEIKRRRTCCGFQCTWVAALSC